MAEEIKAGDTVTLKSGGPPMTVAFVENEQAACEWFDGKKHCSQRFALATLKKYEEQPGFQQRTNW